MHSGIKAFLASRRARRIERAQQEERDELLVGFVVDDVAGPWVTNQDRLDAIRQLQSGVASQRAGTDPQVAERFPKEFAQRDGIEELQ
jgi:hypothetical protein